MNHPMIREHFLMNLFCRPKELWDSFPGAPLTDEQKLEIFAEKTDRPIEFFEGKDMSCFF